MSIRTPAAGAFRNNRRNSRWAVPITRISAVLGTGSGDGEATVHVAAASAYTMRQLSLIATGTPHRGNAGKGVMGTAHTFAGLAGSGHR